MQTYEKERLRKLHRLGMLDTAEEEAFDAITRIAARHFGVPISLISLVDGYRQWFKSRVGLAAQETPRDQAFCAHTIQSTEPMVVSDASQDPRFANNPLVTGDPAIRFYAGAPLLTSDGYALGSLCIIDRKPRELTDTDLQVLRDLATLVMAQVQLRHALIHLDPVSGLPNRTQFLYDAAKAAAVPRVLVLVEPVSLESISDQVQAFGLAFFEDVVRIAAQTIEERVGMHSRIYHVGSTRFLFMLRQDAPLRPEAIVGDLVSSLRAPFSCQGIPVALQASAGIVTDMPRDLPAVEQLQMAIAAITAARIQGAEWMFYRPEDDAAARRATRLLMELPLALRQEGALRLVYQPRVDLRSGLCTGAEALLRWTHAELGVIPPGEFIPLVERTSMVHGVTDWVLRTALRQASRWRAQGLQLCVSINLSPENLREEDLVERLTEGLRRESLPADRIELELTEGGAVLHNMPAALERLRQISQLGIRLAIDDFGTGYSNLAYLQHLPAEILKIDQSLVRALPDGKGAAVMIKSTMAMARELGYRVVAEGVENEAAQTLVASWGCDEVQGYHIARPMEAAALPEWVADHNGEVIRRRDVGGL